MAEIDRTGLRDPASPSGPQRTCIGCRGTDSRSVLLRVVATPEGGGFVAVPDDRARLAGRGAWLHADLACYELAVRRRAFSRALRREVRGSDAVRQALTGPGGDTAAPS